MAQNSAIEWTDNTANFWWGCFKVSDGCKNCYAETLVNRYGKEGIWGSPKITDRELKKGIWKELPKWNRQAKEAGQRKRVFVQSMADFFEDHPQVADWRYDAILLMMGCYMLDFQVLTKRPENVLSMVPEQWLTNWPSNIWIGTSVENQDTADQRIPELLKIPAAVRFLSCEPLLGPVDLRHIQYDGLVEINSLNGNHGVTRPHKGKSDSSINWVIVGGESGPNARPMHPDWARSIRDQCVEAGVAFFMKQMDKKEPIPDDLVIREYPNV